MKRFVVVAVVACGASAEAPRAPALKPIDGADLGCAPAGGGVGLTLGDACLPVAVTAEGWYESPPPAADAAIAATLEREDCFAASNTVVGGGATYVHATCGGRGHIPGEIRRIDADGAVVRVAVPAAGGDARLTFVDGARPLLVVVLDTVGTMVFDARTLAGIAGWERMGGWHNATTWGAAVSPDGAWLAVPDPYGRRVDVVRVSDLSLAGSLFLGKASQDGPGRLAWSVAGLAVTTFPLPYE